MNDSEPRRGKAGRAAAAKEKEQGRQLTPAEERRLARFNETVTRMEAEGYVRSDLTVGIVAANVAVLVAAVPIIALCVWAFVAVNPDTPPVVDGIGQMIVFLVAFVALIVVHELVHGATWAIFAPNHWTDIELGFMKQYLTPYCTCLAPLGKGAYIAGALMPLVLLGLVPLAVGIACGSALLLWIGMVMTLAAGGDVMVVGKLLAHRTAGGDVVFMDHPTQAGMVVLERQGVCGN